MKIGLPTEIKTIEAAKEYLALLHLNNLAYHCEDDATDIHWSVELEEQPTHEEAQQMNKLMDDIYELLPPFENTQSNSNDFDPCGFLLDLDPHHFPDLQDLTTEDVNDLLQRYSREKIINSVLANHKAATVTDEKAIVQYGEILSKEKISRYLLSLHEDAIAK